MKTEVAGGCLVGNGNGNGERRGNVSECSAGRCGGERESQAREAKRTIMSFDVRLQMHILFERFVAPWMFTDERIGARGGMNFGDVSTKEVVLAEGGRAGGALCENRFGAETGGISVKVERRKEEEGRGPEAHIVSLPLMDQFDVLLEMLIGPESFVTLMARQRLFLL